ncbi:hypothetical protein LB467_05080 [Salegentibacter sp. JZCK2]|uniref:hypothetical protein n=1 Tax=Salegentibacter tibetensis TaxID=2873600 RepID=UPI001CCF91BB|nr:hypothetical protein [Salegentibacter tibetensis]MBZ9729050.1 hypothetical protein [Salegentibacter tibetensis]
MSLLYLFSPLYSEFNILLHKISHQFVIEDHHAEKSNEEKHHHTDDHNFLALNHLVEAEDHHNKEEIDDHTHGVISFFNSILNYDSSKDNKEKQIFENKIDKHILSHNINLPQSVLVYKDKKIWDYFSFAEDHEPDITIPPPQSNLM